MTVTNRVGGTSPQRRRGQSGQRIMDTVFTGTRVHGTLSRDRAFHTSRVCCLLLLLFVCLFVARLRDHPRSAAVMSRSAASSRIKKLVLYNVDAPPRSQRSPPDPYPINKYPRPRTALLPARGWWCVTVRVWGRVGMRGEHADGTWKGIKGFRFETQHT